MTDYTKGTLVSIGIVEGITYLWARNNLTGLEAGLLTYLFGLITYFVYVGSKKTEGVAFPHKSKWNGEEIGAGLAGAILPLFFIILIVEFVAMTYFDSNLRH